jgi:hypothetical protein
MPETIKVENLIVPTLKQMANTLAYFVGASVSKIIKLHHLTLIQNKLVLDKDMFLKIKAEKTKVWSHMETHFFGQEKTL